MEVAHAFQALKEKNCPLWILYLVKIFFRNEGINKFTLGLRKTKRIGL